MDPVTLGVISIGSTLASGALSGFAGYSQARYLQGVAKANARVNAQNAQYERQVGEIRAQRVGMAGQQRESQIVATQGASNLSVASGSQKQVQESQRTATQMDEATERANALRRAYGYQVRETQDLAQAKMYGRTAAMTIPASIIGTVSGVSDRWLRASEMGVFGSSSEFGTIGGTGLPGYGGLY